MFLQEAKDQYQKALKKGQRYQRMCMLKGIDPSPIVLDEFLREDQINGTVDLGVLDIPADLVVGTKTVGRKSAFAGDFMPLLSPNSEFGLKWVQLCYAHLGDEGIRDPVKCYEYLGKFYVEEGNKRVSVLKSFDAPMITAWVIRLMPVRTNDPAVEAYYEFIPFYHLTGMYQLNFQRPGGYARLQAILGYEPDHVWTDDERVQFRSGFNRFRDAFHKLGGEELDVTITETLLVWLELHPFSDLKAMSAAELSRSLSAIWDDVKLQSAEEPIAISTEPLIQPEKKLLGKKLSHVHVAFVHMHTVDQSAWVASHDVGRQYMQGVMSERVTVRSYFGVEPGSSADAIMEKAVSEGANVIFATSPPLITACRRIAARYPSLKVLNCALSMPYSGVRTYYSRIYEGKFLAGAIAGAMTKTGNIGYIANYPIFGVPAGINAFALGAQMTNPRARVKLCWTCTDGRQIFEGQNVDVISNREGLGHRRTSWAWEWGTYHIMEDGRQLPLATPTWEWGIFYERIVGSVLDGSYDAAADRDQNRALNYWWGMDSGVIDVRLSPQLPEGVSRLAQHLKKSIKENRLDPFEFRIVDQQGNVRNDGYRWMMADEIMHIDWLCENVDGAIPTFDELLPMSRSMVRLLGVYRDQIPPEPEEVQR